MAGIFFLEPGMPEVAALFRLAGRQRLSVECQDLAQVVGVNLDVVLA